MGKFVLWSGPTHVREGPEETSQSFLAGDLVILDSSTAEVKIATTGADVMGVAIDKASTVDDTVLKYHMVTPEQVWSVESTGTPAATMIGIGYVIASFSAGGMVADVGNTGSDIVIDALDPRDTAASGSRVLVRFQPASCDGWGG